MIRANERAIWTTWIRHSSNRARSFCLRAYLDLQGSGGDILSKSFKKCPPKLRLLTTCASAQVLSQRLPLENQKLQQNAQVSKKKRKGTPPGDVRIVICFYSAIDKTEIGWLTILGCIFLLAVCPLFVMYVWSTCNAYQCSLVGPFETLIKGQFSKESFLKVLPKPTAFGFALYFGWLAFQALLYVVLPGKIGYGQMTPAGHLLPYVVCLL